MTDESEKMAADDRLWEVSGMTGKQFYDWQTAGGTDDVMRLVDCLERADVAWGVIGGSEAAGFSPRKRHRPTSGCRIARARGGHSEAQGEHSA